MKTDSTQTASVESDGDSELPRERIIGETPGLPSRRVAKFMIWARNIKLAIRIEVVLSVLAVASAIVTFAVMSSKDSPFDITTSSTMRTLLLVNLVLLLGLGVSIGHWLIRTRFARRNNAAGSRLHTRVTGAFMAIAMAPPVIMAIFSALFLEAGIKNWFSEPVRASLENSLQVAEAYEIEHRANIERDLLNIALAFNRLNFAQQRDGYLLQELAAEALTTRNLNEVIIIDQNGGVLARADQNLSLQTVRITTQILSEAINGNTVIRKNPTDNTVIGLLRLQRFTTPTFIYITRDLSPAVLDYLERTRSAVDSYRALEEERSDLLFNFNIVFIMIALLILLAAIWIGLWFSSRLVDPLSNLVNAAESVGKGDLDVRVPNLSSRDEVGTLSRAFNRMTNQLNKQQTDLITANAELDERRRFLEEVLEGVSAGVLGLQRDGRIFVPNRSAMKLLAREASELVEKRLLDVVPEFGDILRQAEISESGEAEGEVKVVVRGDIRTLMARISVERDETDAATGYVVTFDDVTEQLANQRTAAWADVARRIAHEIKNPLTPIQLSAERLRRKYGGEIKTDPTVFGKCTDTIIRQVGDLRHMVDEFSSFARMPAPSLKETDIVDTVRQAVFLQEVAAPDIEFEVDLQEEARRLPIDGRLIGQALTNIIKNATESIQGYAQTHKNETYQGHIKIFLSQTSNRTEIRVEDNGSGLPSDQKDRLMEPYVTTRAKGTGLGLAIVRRILEEHGGAARILDIEPHGARVILTLPHKALEARFVASNSNKNDQSVVNAAE